MKRMIFLFTAVLLLGITLVGCSSKTTYGIPIDPAAKFVNISDIMQDPEGFINTDIGLKGKIVIECGSGCWFQLDDGTGQIHVDLTPSNLAIPQTVGSSVTVYGRVVEEDGRKVIHAAGLEF